MWWHTRQHRWCKFYFGQLVWWQGSVVPPSLCWTGFSEEQMLNLTHCEREAASPLLSVGENICSTLTWKSDDRHLSSGVLSVTGEVLMWDHWRGLFFLTSSSYILIHNKEGKVFYLSTLLFLDAVLYTVERICWRILESVHSDCLHNGRQRWGDESVWERKQKEEGSLHSHCISEKDLHMLIHTMQFLHSLSASFTLSKTNIHSHKHTYSHTQTEPKWTSLQWLSTEN